MKRFALLVSILLLSGIASTAWAGAAEEIAEFFKLRGQYANEANIEALVNTYADNAILTGFRGGLRFEGKDGIRTYLTNLYQAYPKRVTMPRHSVTRFYANETVAVLNGYSDAIWTDRSGQVTLFTQRNSIVVVKIDGKWLVVDQHNSRMP